MHVLQHILVKATSVADAVQQAETVSNDATWSDWFQVGGRWDGAFAETFPDIAQSLENGNVLPIWDYPEQARQTLQTAAKRQNRAFLESRDAIAGNEVAISDIPGHIFGMPVADSAAMAQRISESNRKHKAEWDMMLNADSLEAAQSTYMMATYYANKMISLVDERWIPDSAFFDSVEHTCSTKYVAEALTTESDSYPRSQKFFLVAVDFHF